MTRTYWHYPRAAFAEKIYTLLASGPLQAVTLFGPRRTGKTQFLTHDLSPLIESRGHKAVYASFWQTIDSPLALLLYELDLGLRSGSLMTRLKSATRALAPKFKISGPHGMGAIEIDLSKLKGKPPEDHLLLLDQYFGSLANEKKPTFLLFDEFQEIARSKNNLSLIASLRTSLDKRKEGLVAVFTGSSQEGLRQVFSLRQAPFFRFATPIELPPMGKDFVAHQLKAFKSTSKASVDEKTAHEVFKRFDGNPLFFQRWLTALAIEPTLSEHEAIDVVENELSEEFGFMNFWLDLSNKQRLVARMIAEKIDQLYGREGDAFIEALCHSPPPGNSEKQAALSRLSRLGLVDKWEKNWRIADPLFEQWIKHRPKSDF